MIPRFAGCERKAIVAALVCVALFALSACSSDSGTASPEPSSCTPGERMSCACPDGSEATQECSADGTALSACACNGNGNGGQGGQPTNGSGGSPAAPSPSGTSSSSPPGTLPDGGLPSGGASDGGGTGDPEPPPPPVSDVPAPGAFEALAGSGTVGLEWDPVPGATTYRIHWSTSPGVNATSAEGSAEGEPGIIVEGLENGTTYYFTVTAVDAGGSGAPSLEVDATPGGEFVLERFGTGRIPDFASGELVDIAIDNRQHIVIAAEGYLETDLPVFEQDVDDWQSDVFSINPYDTLDEAFIVWSLPRASAEHVPGANTAFSVPNDGSGISSGMDATAAIFWEALSGFPVPLVYGTMEDEFGTIALNVVASFLVFDPDWGRAGLSGRATSLNDPDGSGRIHAGFARGHAHEFTHAFARVSDEYLDYLRTTSSVDETSNVVGTNVCSELPWQHLLVGTSINPSTDELVGAFGSDGLGYHPELLCLMNGTHDNADFYGGNGRLRVEDRMCNYCREITAFRTYERTGVLSGFDAWKGTYRASFYDSEGFSVPAVVPQTNSDGEVHYQACVP